MSYCVPLGIPHSTFLSWDEADQDKAIAWNIEKSHICPKCGTRDSDWRDEKGRRLVPAPYDVVTKTCAGCEDLEEFKAQDEIRDHMTPAMQVRLARHDPSRDLVEDEDDG